ncbi:hypothetical protein GGF43_000486 [Coemansia sp. RSA 2618]|nr:hypothetical protein GGF43_000486 [Coemansia sp. RSA 2618]
MAYQRGRDEDEQLHRRHHRAWQQRQSRVLLWDIDASNDDDAFMSVAYYDRGLAAKPAGRTRASIRIVDPHVASKREVSRALDILNHVNAQLGACLLTLDELLQRQRKVFVYVSPARRVEGCVLAEIIRGAHRVLPASSVHDGVVCGSEQVPAVCGISRVWVASDARRHGVARQMFDAVRERFAYGCHIGRDQIAFTQPTADGRALAESLFQRKDFLVYVED